MCPIRVPLPRAQQKETKEMKCASRGIRRQGMVLRRRKQLPKEPMVYWLVYWFLVSSASTSLDIFLPVFFSESPYQVAPRTNNYVKRRPAAAVTTRNYGENVKRRQSLFARDALRRIAGSLRRALLGPKGRWQLCAGTPNLPTKIIPTKIR